MEMEMEKSVERVLRNGQIKQCYQNQTGRRTGKPSDQQFTRRTNGSTGSIAGFLNTYIYEI